jgi:membrane protease YdiL (CAAX protease family)
VELFFRGFLVIGMVSMIGKKAILPMAVLYCFVHFGKPFGEALSSFFGGYILGVLAYYTRNVFGGLIVHLGIAYLMEILAFGQKSL